MEWEKGEGLGENGMEEGRDWKGNGMEERRGLERERGGKGGEGEIGKRGRG